MGVDQDRQETAGPRRKAIIEALNNGFDPTSASSHLSRFKELASKDEPRYIIGNADIDGLVSAQMLAAATGWSIAAVIDRTGDIRLHPQFATPEELH